MIESILNSLRLGPSLMILTLLGIGYCISYVLYALVFSPMAKIPGPWYNKISRLAYTIHLRRGTTVHNTVALHKKYGPVVVLNPTEVSFTSIDTAWPQIYGFRTGALKGHATHEKDSVWLGPRPFGVDSVLRASGDNHGRQRRLLSHAFSEKALHAQEDLLQSYVDKLVDAIRLKSASTGAYINAVEYYNWTTFDIIGALVLGKSFGNLDDLETHFFIHNMFKFIETFSIGYIRKFWPFLSRLIIPPANLEARAAHQAWIAKQVDERLSRDTDSPDFMTFILAHNGEKGEALSDAEIKSNSALLLAAGSETTATLLSGATWLLLKNPDVLQRLRRELHQQFPSYEDITLSAVAKSPYLLAVLDESLRIYPPVPCGFPRVIAEGGEEVSGYWIPPGTSSSVSSFAAHHDPANFTDPERFDPERWLGDSKYADDKRQAMQPFSFGPHACLGKNLAYGEMRLILAKVAWTYDFEMDNSAQDWLEQCRVFSLWKKAPLPVHFIERRP